jgi:hypothetical protein
MPRYEEDWRRRFTEWDLDEEDDQPRPAVVKPDPAPAEQTHEPGPSRSSSTNPARYVMW